MLEMLVASFTADFELGRLFRKTSPVRKDLIGKEAGYLDNHGYFRVSVGGKKLLRSHVIFAMWHGRMPAKHIDHINRNRADDRIDNLREADHAENMWNRTPMSRALPMGVCARNGKFSAKIMRRREAIHLGTFDTVEEAHAAYQTKRKELFNEFA